MTEAAVASTMLGEAYFVHKKKKSIYLYMHFHSFGLLCNLNHSTGSSVHQIAN